MKRDCVSQMLGFNRFSRVLDLVTPRRHFSNLIHLCAFVVIFIDHLDVTRILEVLFIIEQLLI